MSEIADEMVALAANARRERLRDSGPCTPDVQHDVEASAMRAALDAIAPMILDEAAKVADGFGWQQQRFVSDRLEAAFDRADEIAAAIRAMGER
jgi:hypothetical protein